MLTRRLRFGVAAALAGAAGYVGIVSAAVPEGPRLAFTRLSREPTRYELATIDPSGVAYSRVLQLPLPSGQRYPGFDVPSWSRDGSSLTLISTTRKPTPIVLVESDGGERRPIPGTRGGFLPLFSPDGRTLAFSRFRREPPGHRKRDGRHHLNHRSYESTSVWITDLTTGGRRQLTPWRDGLDQFASSFSPDGSMLSLTRLDERRTGEAEVVVMSAMGGHPRLLIGKGFLPVYSPDGSKLALFQERERRFDKRRTPSGITWRVEEHSELYVIDADGTHLRRLTHTPHKDELFASWDPSGQRLAYIRLHRGNSEAVTAGFGDSIMQINSDGTCETEIISAPHTAFYGPVWRPGPGREAGRIEC